MAYASDEWTRETCEKTVERLLERAELPFPDNKSIYSSMEKRTTYMFLSDYCTNTCINYGQRIEIREKGLLKKRKE